jgi:hypothetical protein
MSEPPICYPERQNPVCGFNDIAEWSSCLSKEESMESVQTTTPQSALSSDILHNDNPTRLMPEQIAKALAHHNHRHVGDDARKVQAAAKIAKKHK